SLADLEGLALDAIGLETHPIVKRPGGMVVAADAQLNPGEPADLAGVLQNSLDQPGAQPPPAIGRPHIHAHEKQLMPRLHGVVAVAAGCAHETVRTGRARVKATEHDAGTPRYPPGNFLIAAKNLFSMGTPKSLGAQPQAFQADVAV